MCAINQEALLAMIIPGIMASTPYSAVAPVTASTHLAVGTQTAPYLHVYDVSTWTKITLGSGTPASGPQALAFSPDRSLLACGLFGPPYLKIVDTATWSGIAGPSSLPTTVCRAVAFNPAGTLLAVGSDDNNVYVYNTSTWALVATLATAVSDVLAIDFSPDGAILSVGAALTAVVFLMQYRTSDWMLLNEIDPLIDPPDSVRSLDWRPDGDQLALSHQLTPFISVYNKTGADPATWSRMTNPSSLPPSFARGCAWRPDGAHFALACESSPRVVIYETVGWTKLTQPATIPTSAGSAASYSATGTYLAISNSGAGFGNGITVYDTSTNPYVAISIPSAGNSFACAFN